MYKSKWTAIEWVFDLRYRFAPPQITGNLSNQWFYDELYEQWEKLAPADTDFRHGGFYSKNLTSDLKIIALNTNLCARQNYWLLFDPIDPAGQLEWFVSQLQQAEQSGQTVHVLGHIPPDATECTATWFHNYLKIIERYRDVIVGMFFGHTHQDEIRLYYSNIPDQRPLGVGLLGGSITPFGHVNPCYKIYSLNQKVYMFKLEAIVQEKLQCSNSGLFFSLFLFVPGWSA